MIVSVGIGFYIMKMIVLSITLVLMKNVGDDVYNYIINDTYTKSYFVLVLMFWYALVQC